MSVVIIMAAWWKGKKILYFFFFGAFSFVLLFCMLAFPMLLYNFTLHASSFAFGRKDFIGGHAPLTFFLILLWHFIFISWHFTFSCLFVLDVVRQKPSDVFSTQSKNVLSESFDWMKYKSKQQAVEYIQCLSCSQRWNINEERVSFVRGVGDTFILCRALDVRLSGDNNEWKGDEVKIIK